MKVGYENVHFEEIKSSHHTTLIFKCRNYNNGFLGEVRWSYQWRQYCFNPQADYVLPRDYLDDIRDFLQQLVDDRANVYARGAAL